VNSDEPFTRLLTQGMVLKDGAKMSKSKGNTVDPQALIDSHGADTVRLFSLFAAPPDQSLEWSEDGVEGAHRFIRRLWRLMHSYLECDAAPALDTGALTGAERDTRRKVHETIAKVTDDMSRRQTFNTAIAAIMELCNELGRLDLASAQGRAVLAEGLDCVVRMLVPVTPHLCHHLWGLLSGSDEDVSYAPWPVVDERALVRDSVEIVVQVNGKVRARMDVPADATRGDLETLALAQENAQRFIEGSTVRKVIVVPGKLVNIVAN
jgi:leucyl-tRNA synthetase